MKCIKKLKFFKNFMNYKDQNEDFVGNRILNHALDNENDEQKIIEILVNFQSSLESKDQDDVKYYLNEISKANPEKVDMCNNSCFVSNQIFQKILSLISPNTPFKIISSASLAISSFSYLFSMNQTSSSRFNTDDLFLILQPETLFFIFNFIKENSEESISSLIKMLRSYCIASQKFRDTLISEFSIDSICGLIIQKAENNFTDNQFYKDECINNLLSLIRDICYYPISEQQAISIISLLNGFDIFTNPIEIDYQIIRTILYIIEKNSNESGNYSGTVEMSFFENHWNPAPLIIEWKNHEKLNDFLDELNKVKNYRSVEYNKSYVRIKDDICSISLLIYQLTNKEVLLLPVEKFIDFMIYNENEAGEIKVKQNIVMNALIFFSIYMNESEENFVECDKKEFFNKLSPAIDKMPARIRIQAGHVLFGLIEKASQDQLKCLLYQSFFAWAFKLIQFDDFQLSIEMLRIMMNIIHFVIESGDENLAKFLKEIYDSEDYNMDETLNNLFYDNEDNDLSSFAGETLKMIKDCFVQYNLLDADENEFANDEEEEIDNDENEETDEDEIDISKADEFFFNTKPDPWIF